MHHWLEHAKQRQLLFDEVKYCHPGSWTPALGKRKTVSKREQCPVCEENWNDKQSGRISHFPEHCKTLSCDDVSMIQVPKRMLFIVVSKVKEFPTKVHVQITGRYERNTLNGKELFRSILTTWDLARRSSDIQRVAGCEQNCKE